MSCFLMCVQKEPTEYGFKMAWSILSMSCDVTCCSRSAESFKWNIAGAVRHYVDVGCGCFTVLAMLLVDS